MSQPAPAQQWLDAQLLLRRVCAGMAVGELLHGPSFSLFDSTTAIEIGDPKMDIGLHRSEETGTAEELIAAGGAPVALPPRVLLALMDRLLRLEATWHAGSMLPMTVFTSLHMLQPDRLAPNAPLHAYCLALRSACSVCVDMAHAAAVTEDEDLFVHTFGIRLLDLPGPKPVAAALRVLAAAEEQLEQQAAGGSGEGGGPAEKQQQRWQQERQQGEGEEEGAGQPSAEEAAALLARIRFRRLLLEALQSLQQYSQAGVESARRQCQLATAQLDLLAGSAALAAPHDAAPGFVPDVNRRHMGLVPPRPVQVVSLEQAVESWRGLLSSLADALHSLLFVRGSWAALKAALAEFAAGSRHAIVRSALHLQLIKPLPPPPPPPPPAEPAPGVPASGASPAVGLPAAPAVPAVPASSPKGGRKAAAEVPAWCPGREMVCRELGLVPGAAPGPEAELFLEQAAIAIQGQAYALCLNRCRQRRRLRRQLEDWKNIFDHAFNADVTPEMQAWLAGAGWRWGAEQREGVLQGQGPAAAWAEREAAGCALLHLQLGFPLDLYSPCEYLQLYWYCDYLLDCQYRLGRILHAAAPQPPPRAAPSPKRGSAKPRGGRGGGQSAAAEAAGAAREVELLLLEIERHLAQGMFRAAIALRQLGLIPTPATPFNAEEQRYAQRFGCMELLFRPEPLPYSHFRASTDASGLPPARVLAAAMASFQRAAERAGGALAAAPLRALLRREQVRHLEGVQRIASQNAVAAKLLAATSARAAAAPDGQQPAAAFKAQFDFKTALASSNASFYPAIVLKH